MNDFRRKHKPVVVGGQNRRARPDYVKVAVSIPKEAADILDSLGGMTGLSSSELVNVLLEPMPYRRLYRIVDALEAALRSRAAQIEREVREFDEES